MTIKMTVDDIAQENNRGGMEMLEWITIELYEKPDSGDLIGYYEADELRIPEDTDFSELLKVLGVSSIAGGYLESASRCILDKNYCKDSGKVLPRGYCVDRGLYRQRVEPFYPLLSRVQAYFTDKYGKDDMNSPQDSGLCRGDEK